MNPVESSATVPVAIIGMACLFPRSEGLAAYWSLIQGGSDAITEVPDTHWRPEDYFDPDPKSPDRTYARRGGFLDPVDFPPLDFGIAPNNLEATDTTQLLGLLVARRALDDAGYGEGSGKSFDRGRASVILGVTGTLELVIPLGARLGHPIWRRALDQAGVAPAQADDVVRRISAAYPDWQENSFPGLLGNVAAGRIANRLDLHGTNCVIDAACASSVGALNLALLELASGRCDLALSGGLDTFNDIFMYMCFSKTPALSPTGDARPFDAGCDGTILGEGLGVVVLKRLADARRDGDRVYAVIRAVGTSSDGKGNAVYAPSAAGQARALRQAYRLAGFSPATVGLVEAHGTGTKVGDATELSALNEVFGAAGAAGETWCALGSVKSQIGHTKAAAGAAGLIKAALALHHKVLPPTIKVDEPLDGVGPGQSPFYVNTAPRPWLADPDHPRRAAVSAFGFGGSNYHCVLEEADPARRSIDWDGSVQIVAFSARTREGLLDALDRWPADLAWDAVRLEAARSRAGFRTDDAHRLLVVAERGDDLKALLGSARASVVQGGKSGRRPADQVHAGRGKTPGKLAWLFPGQGSQYVGMQRALACSFPPMLDALDLAQRQGPDDAPGARLADRIYPLSTFTESERAANEAALRATEVAQPAIGAVSLGLLRILEHFGVRADVSAGHSFGELTALCAAGWIDDRAFASLARERGRLMAAEAARGGGAMLAVMAAVGVVEDLLAAEGLGTALTIANKNGPRQFVLSGPTGDIDRAAQAFEARGVPTRRLAVSAAFHSGAVARASEPFLASLERVDVRPTRLPVFANGTARPYAPVPEEVRAQLSAQLARPVEFAAMIEAMADAGVSTFVEVGPDAKLSGLVRSILDAPGRPAHVVAVDANRGSRGNGFDLASALAELAALGYPVELERWDPQAPNVESAGDAPTRKPALTVKVTGANLTPKLPRRSSAAEGPPSVAAPTPSPRRAVAAAASSTMASPMSMPSPIATSPPAANDGPSNGHRPTRTNGVAPPVAPAPRRPAPAPVGDDPAQPAPLPAADPATLSEALRAAQEGLVALQRLGERTAALHRQFLEGQERTQRSFQTLLERQQLLIQGARPAAPAAPSLVANPQPTPTLRRATPTPTPTPTQAPPSIAPEPPIPVRAAAPVEPAPAARSADLGRVQAVLMDVVSEKTGYPTEMLEPSMQLDADLGIDSIKRVEILSALQERLPDAPPVKPEHLGTLRTLSDIVDFLAANEPAAAAVAVDGADAAPAGPGLERVQAVLMEVVSEKTGYPTEMLEPSMQLDADLGIDSIKRVEILSALQERLPDAPPVKPEHLGTLRTLSDIVDFLAANEPAAAAVAVDGADAAPAGPGLERVQAVLMEVVSEKTGYPTEMLEPSMQLDADLGIDSIKRVEILSALQERLPDAPPVKPEHLGTLRTLSDIVDFLATGAGPERAAPASTSGPAAVPVATSSARVQRLVVGAAAIEEGRGGPHPGIAAGAEVWISDDGRGLAGAVVEQFRERGIRARVVDPASGGQPPARLDGLILLGSSSADPDRVVKDAFRLVRGCAQALRQAGPSGGASLVSVARLDGAFGFRQVGAGAEPITGGLAGLVKTAGHEWPEVACRALDLDPALGHGPRAARRLVDELLTGGPAEVGLSHEARTTPVLEPDSAAGLRDATGTAPVGPGELLIVTGGARGVTAEVAVALAGSFRPTLALLGRSPAPRDEPEWLARLEGEAEIKRALATRAGGESTPQRIGEEFRRIEAGREVRRNLERIAAAGSRVVYREVDVRDAQAVASVVDGLRAEFGPVRGLVHGAGVLADRRIEDQTDAQFDAVHDTKVGGLRALLDATSDDPLGLLVGFSSSTARFGRTGQVAYAAANEVLNKVAQVEAARRPACRVVSVNWGPWEGGMVNPALRSVFESEGIGLIPLEAGARYLVDELRSAAGRPVEVVVLGGASVPAALAGRLAAVETSKAPGPAEGHQQPGRLATVFERALDVAALPVLRNHVIDGRGVLPLALSIEWLAQGALQRNPGLSLVSVEEVRLLKGAVARDERPETLSVAVDKAERDGARFRVPAELRGQTADGRSVVHVRAEVVLADRLEPPDRRVGPGPQPACVRSARSIYHDILFHGPELQGLERVETLGSSGATATVRTGSAPSTWVDRPFRQTWLTDPLAIDCAFQLLSLWCHEQAGAPSLPTRVGRYVPFRRQFPAPRVRVVAEISRPAEHRAVAEIEFLDGDGQPIARIEGYECVIDASLGPAFRRNRLGHSRPVEDAR